MDESVGRVLKALRDSGQEDRTIVVFHSDNGAPPKNGSRNTPLRGKKGSTWEGGIRIPFVMQWKGTIPAGQVVDAPVISLDLLRTALAAARVDVPDDSALDGSNLLPFLTGATQKPPHEALFWRYGPQMAVRAGDWKLTKAIDWDVSPPAVKTGLYQVAKDAGEQNDLAAQHPEKVLELQKLWDDWNKKNVEPLWSDEVPANSPKKGSAKSQIPAKP
jgi:arylsulfatase A-like enzyme